MSKRVNSYLKNKKKYNFIDVDFHDFMELVDEGYKNEEIAMELGVSKEQVERLRGEVNNY